MRGRSLHLRLITGGMLAILVALAVSGGGLVLLFERHVARTIAEDLDVYLKQLLAGIDFDAEGKLVLTQMPTDPRFGNPFSGLYWQVTDGRGQILRSRSLWDATLNLPADKPTAGEIHQHQAVGPGGSSILIAERRVIIPTSNESVDVRLAVATNLARVATAASAFAKDLALSLGLLGLALAIATSLQVTLGLRPLEHLRRGVADIREGRRRRLPIEVPAEVQPLVEEVNALIDTQETEIERSRNRAADLAHGLKTPLSALAADAMRLREQGQHEVAEDIETVGEAMSRYVDRELARARVRGLGSRGASGSCEVEPLAQSLIATLARTPGGSRVTFEPQIAAGLSVPIDRADLAEVLGNLLENATRHAVDRVRIVAASGPSGPSIAIEDDGKGIAPTQLPHALERGGRLDERGEGAGLGLAIVQDVLGAYDWRLGLARSELGGLKATIAPIAAESRESSSADASLYGNRRVIA